MEMKIKLQNGKQAQSLYRAMPSIMQGHLSKATDQSVRQIQRNAMREAPVNKSPTVTGGNLRQSIKARMLGAMSGEVSVGAKYGVYVHEGTRPHLIRVRNKKVLANKRGKQFFGRSVMHRGTKANPFLTRAVDQSEGNVNKFFGKAIQNALSTLTSL